MPSATLTSHTRFNKPLKAFWGTKTFRHKTTIVTMVGGMTFNVAFNLLFAEISLFEGRLENLNFSILDLKNIFGPFLDVLNCVNI